jgi:Protein of unknown function (DUF2975)
MSQHGEPKAQKRRQKRAFASPGMTRNLAGTVMIVGAVAAIWGVAYDINGATQAQADVVVSVHMRPEAALEVHGTTPKGAPGTVLVKDGAEGIGPFMLTIPGIPAETSTTPPYNTAWLEGHGHTLTMHSWGSTVPEQLLNRGGFAVVGLCMGVGAIWLRRVLISIAEGRPFQPGNAARIAGIGGLVVLASLANDILPVLGSNLVLQRLGLTGSSSPIYAEVVPSLGLLLTVPFLLVLAEAFRRGTELAQDVEGLV